MAHVAETLKSKGNVAFRDGNYLEAEELYTQAIQKYSRNPLIFTNRANVRLRLQQWYCSSEGRETIEHLTDSVAGMAPSTIVSRV